MEHVNNCNGKSEGGESRCSNENESWDHSTLPENENVWKIILNYTNVNKDDMMSLRQVCQDANKATAPHVQFSEKKFKKFMKDMGDFDHGYWASNDINNIQKLEEQVFQLIDLNYKNEDFRLIMQTWIMTMNNELLNQNDASSLINETNVLEESAKKLMKHADKKKEEMKPGTRIGLKKMGKGVAGTLGAAATVVTIPIALLGVPMLLKSRRSRLGEMFLAPTAISALFTYSMFKGINDPNIRNIQMYHDMRQCSKRIEAKLKSHGIEVK